MKMVMGLGVLLVTGTVCFAGADKEAVLKRMDADQDGKVTGQEYVAFFGQGFIRMDKNKDGVLDKTEFVHPAFKHIDTDNDGILTAAEDKAYRERAVKLLDVNGDQVISKEEYLGKPEAADKASGSAK